MRQKIPVTTRIGCTLLTMSFLTQVGYLLILLYAMIQTAANTEMSKFWTLYINTLAFEFYLLCSAAEPIFFSGLLKDQARGRSGFRFGTILILVILAAEQGSSLQTVASGSSISSAEIVRLITGLAIPAVILAAIALSNRLLAILGAAGATVITISRLEYLTAFSALVSKTGMRILMLSEVLYCLGLIIGLLGVRKIPKASAGNETC